MSRAVAIVGNPENRRVAFFQRALGRRGMAPAVVVAYRDLLSGRSPFDEVPRGAFLRIESPGENFEVERGLLSLGAARAEREGSPHLGAKDLAGLKEDRGRVLFPRQWYLGYCACLRSLDAAVAARGDLIALSNAADIAVMCDKRQCHRRLERSGISVPPALGTVTCFDELVARMESWCATRVFVKLAHGSSASGVVALERRREKWLATTTVEMEQCDGETRLYNSLSLRRYTGVVEVRPLIDALAPHRVHVETWLPKAALDGRVFDLRVVVIAGEPRHMVVRTSRGPITNLHLGNRRGDLDRLLAKLGEEATWQLEDTCRRVARQFPRSMQMGLDVLFVPGMRRHYVLEVNAFGDLLPRVLHDGQDTYEAQVGAAVELHGRGCGEER